MAKYKIEFYHFLCLVVSVTGDIPIDWNVWWRIPWDGKVGPQEEWRTTHPNYAEDMTSIIDREKFIWLASDLYEDCEYKMRQLFYVKKQHEKYVAYHVGVIIGRIREKYRNMLDIYKGIKNKKYVRSRIMTPSSMVVRPIHFVMAMEMVHHLEVEIDKLIHVLETETGDALTSRSTLIAGRPAGPPPLMPAARQGRVGRTYDAIKGEEESNKIEEVKRKVREEYLMRKLGKPENLTTTMKRFHKKWPVRETWSLEAYT